MTHEPMPHGAWPRFLKCAWAAAWAGVSPNTFLREVKAKIWPEPDTRGRRKIWDLKKMNEYQDRRDQDESGGDPLMEALNDRET